MIEKISSAVDRVGRIGDGSVSTPAGSVTVGVVGRHVLLGTLTLLVVSPLLLALLMSTQTRAEIYQPGYLLPGSAGLENYQRALFDFQFGLYLLNSLIMSIIVVIGKVGLALIAALALVYYRIPYKNGIFIFILLTLTFPVPVRIVPLFDMMVSVGWTNSMLALTIPYFASATALFIFRQHFLSIPDSLTEAARLDGVGPLKFLREVVIPMSSGMIAGVSVITFIYTWHQYLWPLVIIEDDANQVVVVGIKLLEGSQWSGQVEWGVIMAGSILAVLPPLVVLILLRKPLLQAFGVQQK
ncbi:carbohydrate ABC transporter permease [Natrarchaeobius oligotrophus]|uniref:Carbohydrate ABC transporter permease n=1 Tax=Natrarchaeobius chitinivorans TaxID=1679083 RepID=A0A3N6NJ44_NATCH|nr:carbohydrate ABC transporter permease [Natrarchaeobius chitinivorans]RQG99172.1 carbohydrate ABC transporter permease [Natrarchaeobius chitinivorans]